MGRTTSETKKSRPIKASTIPDEQIEQVYDYWKLLLDKKRAVLSPERRELIGAAIHDYGIEGAMEAIRGCSLSPFHMGGNKQRKRYDSLELIFRNSDKIEFFLQIADDNPYVEPF